MVNEVVQLEGSGTGEAGTSRRPQDALLCDMDLPHRAIFYPLAILWRSLRTTQQYWKPPTRALVMAGVFGDAQRCRYASGSVTEVRRTVRRNRTRREYNHLYSLVADVNNQALLDLRSCINFTWVTSASGKITGSISVVTFSKKPFTCCSVHRW